MKSLKIKWLGASLLASILLLSAFAITGEEDKAFNTFTIDESENQTVNLFVTHGHCSTPFGGLVSNFELKTHPREDMGNPLENMQLSFAIDPNTFKVCTSDELTAGVKTPGVFINDKNDRLSFRSTQVYTMGVDWYQVNGVLSIKGEEREVQLFVTGIRESNQLAPSSLVLHGRLNLYDWGIDYDRMVYGNNMNVTQWMYLNMKVDLEKKAVRS